MTDREFEGGTLVSEAAQEEAAIGFGDDAFTGFSHLEVFHVSADVFHASARASAAEAFTGSPVTAQKEGDRGAGDGTASSIDDPPLEGERVVPAWTGLPGRAILQLLAAGFFSGLRGTGHIRSVGYRETLIRIDFRGFFTRQGYDIRAVAAHEGHSADQEQNAENDEKDESWLHDGTCAFRRWRKGIIR